MSHAALKVSDRLTADERHNAARPESEDRVRCHSGGEPVGARPFRGALASARARLAREKEAPFLERLHARASARPSSGRLSRRRLAPLILKDEFGQTYSLSGVYTLLHRLAAVQAAHPDR
jgi:hypothetical protein